MAMSLMQQDKISGLMDVVGLGGPNRRDTILRVLTDLFILDGDRQSPAERNMQEELMLNLLSEAGLVMRRELAERLACHPAPPLRIVQRLARDEIEIARSLLLHCLTIDDDELALIARTDTQDHVLAIVERPAIGPKTAEAILARANRNATIALCRNSHASLTPAALSRLQDMASADPDIARALIERGNIEPTLMLSLFWQADSAKRETIIRELAARADGIDQLAPDIPVISAPMRKASKAGREAAHHGLTAILVQHRTDDFCVMFAKLMGIKQQLMKRIMRDRSGEPFAIACAAAGFPHEAFTTLVILYNPEVGQSVERVYGLGGFYDKVPEAVAWRMLEAWNLALREDVPVFGMREAIHDAFVRRTQPEAANTSGKLFPSAGRPGGTAA